MSVRSAAVFTRFEVFHGSALTTPEVLHDSLTVLLPPCSGVVQLGGRPQALSPRVAARIGSYGGTVWHTSSLKLSETRFLPGYWTGGTRDGIGYVTRNNSDNGFGFAAFASTSGDLQWQGVWWDESGSTGVQYGNTRFVPADADNDGYTDLDYVTSQNWGSLGFTLAQMPDNGTGLTYAGQQWDPTSLPLGASEFLPSG